MCVALEWLRAIVCLLVSTVVSFFLRGAFHGISTHWAFPVRLLQGRDSGNRHDLTQKTHHDPILCAPGDQIPSHSPSSCSTTTKLRQTTGCVSPDRLASRVNCFSLTLCQPGHFVPTRLHRHCASQPRVSWLCAQHLVSLGLDSPQRGQLTRLACVLSSPTRTSPSLFLGGIASLAVWATQQNHPSWMKVGDPSWVHSQTGADKSSNKTHKTVSHSPADVERLRWALELIDGPGKWWNITSQLKQLGRLFEKR